MMPKVTQEEGMALNRKCSGFSVAGGKKRRLSDDEADESDVNFHLCRMVVLFL